MFSVFTILRFFLHGKQLNKQFVFYAPHLESFRNTVENESTGHQNFAYFPTILPNQRNVNREYIYSVAVHQKYLMRLGELINFEPWRENYHFSQPS